MSFQPTLKIFCETSVKTVIFFTLENVNVIHIFCTTTLPMSAKLLALRSSVRSEEVAEGVGVEPTKGVNPYRFSKPAH